MNLCLTYEWNFVYVCSLFLVGNDKSISKHQNVQDKKFWKLCNFVVRDVSSDPEQVIYNFWSHILTEAEKSKVKAPKPKVCKPVEDHVHLFILFCWPLTHQHMI